MMASNYNALIKSMPDEENSRGQVRGKVLLTELNLVPPKWTMLFRGKYLSRDVNMAKLLCSPEDPIIIYKGIVKPPSSPYSVQIDCTSIPQAEGMNGKIVLEVKPLDSVRGLRKRIGEELGKADEDITLMYNDRVLKNYESLQDCKIVKDGCQIEAKIKDKETMVEVVNLEEDEEKDLPVFCETYWVCLGGNKEEDKRKMAFFNVSKKGKEVAKRGKVEIRSKSSEFIEAMDCDTVGILKRRICAVFQVDSEAHSIYKKPEHEHESGMEELWDYQILESLCFQEGESIKIKEKSSRRKYEEKLEKNAAEAKKQKMLKRKLEETALKKEMKTWSEEKKLEWQREKEKKQSTKIRTIKFSEQRGAGGCRWSSVCLPPARFRSFGAQDVDRNAITMFGEVPTHKWNLYSFGMTLYGTCSNSQCISRTTTFKNNNGVSHIAGYGNIILTPERFKFPCSACKEMFPVKEFVLCGGRALFRFKKSGIGEVVKNVVIESEYDLKKHKTFDNTAKNKKVQTSSYDFIEITTVKLWCGLYTCVRCDEMIRFKQDENVLRCGHAYHNECSPVNVGGSGDGSEDNDSNLGCCVCEAEPVQSMYDMLGMEGGSSSSEAALVRPL